MRDLELRGAGSLLGDEQSGHVAALGFELYMQMLDEAVQAMGDADGDEELPEPVRLDVNVDAYVPADYIPYEQAKVDVHRRIAGARDVAELEELRAELADRFGDPPEPLENLITLQQARIKLGEAGARAVSFRQGRLAVTPIELDSVRAKRIRAEIPGALYESGKSQLSVRVPDDPAKRFPAVVRAADVLLGGRSACRRDASHGLYQAAATLDRDHERTSATSWRSAPFLCRPRSSPDAARRHPGQRGGRGRRHRHREGRLRPLAQRRREVERAAGRQRAQAAGVHRVHRAAKKAPAKPAEGQPKQTDAEFKKQCKQQYDQLRDQVLGLLISFEWIEREAEEQGVKVTDAEVKKSFEEQKKQSFPKDADYQKFLKDSGQTEEDVMMRVRLDALSNKIRDKVTKGKDKVTDEQIDGLLRQEQGAVRAARAARPEHRPDQDRGQGRAGQGGARGRRVVQVGRQGVLDRRRLQGAGRQAARRRQGPAGEGVRRRDLRGRQGQDHRPGQDAVRLLRVQGRQGHAGVAADARAGQGDDQAGARLAEPAEGAGRVRQGLPQEVEGEDGLPRGLRDAGLQERAEADADAHAGRGQPAPTPQPRAVGSRTGG